MSARAPVTIDATPAGSNESLWRKLVQRGSAAWRVEARGATRASTRLQSAKVLDGAGEFLCEAMIKDRSATGLRLALARNCGLPPRFGLHIDLTGELVTASLAWRRDRLVGARIVANAPPAPMKRTDRVALAGRYYAVPGR
jgi:hypothetical protein